jgi:two-component system, NarL family, sensor histidine kinase EvgS
MPNLPNSVLMGCVLMAKILVVDDEQGIRILYNAMLGNNYSIIEASNGQEALSIFKQQHPDLIITDLNMPVMNGLELIRELRACSREVRIVVAATFFPGEKAQMMEAGADVCLLKPVPFYTLEQTISNLLAVSNGVTA